MAAWDRFQKDLDALRRDRTSGSQALAHRGVQALAGLVAAAPGRAREAFAALARVRPAMAAIPGLAAAFLEAWRTQEHADASRTATEVREDARRAEAATARVAARSLRDARCVVTLSRSGTVRDALVEAAPSRVRVLRSEPGGEGVALADELEAAGLAVTVAPDDAVDDALQDADAVLVGADALTATGAVNKVGTHRLADAARPEGIPVVVAATSHKWHPWLRKADLAEETVDGTHPLFEATPWSRIDHVASDDGPVRPDAAAARLATARLHWERHAP